jgi:integrase
MYKHAQEDSLINPADNPARKVEKPRRLPSTRRAVADKRLAEINHAAAATGDDPELDTLLLRLHTETACRRGGALALRPQDLDPEQCLILLREKGETVRWQPVSPTLMTALLGHAGERHAPPDGQLLRYRNGRRITYRRYERHPISLITYISSELVRARCNSARATRHRPAAHYGVHVTAPGSRTGTEHALTHPAERSRLSRSETSKQGQGTSGPDPR